MWEDFFYFSKGERRGIILLILLIGLVLGGTVLYSNLKSVESPVINDNSLAEYHAFIESVHQRDSLVFKKYRSYREKQPVVLAPFDPNSADSQTFVRMGLKPYIARNILHYRAKGGKFRTPESFAKIYGITPGQFKTLSPYIYIGSEFQKSDTIRTWTSVQQDTLKAFKYHAGVILNLNMADTTELKKVPGIGSALARVITGYRSRLGGYYKVEQLQDLNYIPDSLNKWFKVGSPSIHRINLNRASVERLKSHPYINFYQAKVIVEYRKKKGHLDNLNQLSLYEEFAPADMERIKPYVCF